MKYRKSIQIIIVIASLLLVVLLMDIWMMFGQIRQQTKDAGISQLENISRQLEKTIGYAENTTMETAIEASEYLDDRAALETFIKKKKKSIIKSGTGAYNVYIAGGDWFIIPDFKAPKNYDVRDRVWYSGALSKNGDVYVSSPYQDAMTGEICYSVSVMMGDKKTVLAIDYTMDTVQKYIEEMYSEGGKHAVIVTEDGIIAGCSDEKLIGKQLSDAVPEYSGVWSLSKNSDRFVNSRIKDGLLYENLYATKSGNGWYLIVSISDWELYRSSYIQLIVTILIAVALFITVILTYVYARRNRMFSNTEHMGREEHEKRFRNKKKKETGKVNKRYRNRILIFMILLLVFSLYTNISATYKWGNVQMKSEAESYRYDLAEWVDTQKSILDMFASVISTNPEMLDDYDGTIAYLDRITKQYPEISATYIGSPKLDPQIYMNNGWVPKKGWKADQRPWYKEAMHAKDGWSITAPYFDDKTGGYCVTISEQVYDSKTGRFLGVFGIDFYMDKLVEIMAGSYSDKGYAFLVDTEGYIVNHPYGKYQMSKDNQTSVLDLPYGKVKPNGKDTDLIRDYDGSYKILLATVDQFSKFSIYVVEDAWMIYGRVIIYALLCLAAFLVGMVLVYRLLSHMIEWQDEVNRRLEKAAQTDAMTGLMNKSSTESAIAGAVENGKGSLLIIDLDSFKLVNDIYGHDMGDRVLIRVSELILSMIRDNDIAGRIGGDEFAAYCEGLTDEKVLAEKAEYLNKEITKTAKEYMGTDVDIPLGCSVGAVLVPEGGREYSVLFSKADQALHQAKKNGKHNIYIHQEQDKTVEEESDSGLANLRMVFGERNQKRTAMIADDTTFRDVYRFMMRYSSNCSSDLFMVVFNLQADDEEKMKTAADDFVEISSKLLRSCDVILKYNSRQVLVLLVEADEKGYINPVNRIMQAWADEGDAGVIITHQKECLNSRNG